MKTFSGSIGNKQINNFIAAKTVGDEKKSNMLMNKYRVHLRLYIKDPSNLSTTYVSKRFGQILSFEAGTTAPYGSKLRQKKQQPWQK